MTKALMAGLVAAAIACLSILPAQADDAQIGQDYDAVALRMQFAF